MCVPPVEFQPNERLKKMMNFLKLLLAINVILLFVSLIKVATSKSTLFDMNFFTYILSTMILSFTICTVNYMMASLFLFFTLFDVAFTIINIGTFFQMLGFNQLEGGNKKDYIFSLVMQTIFLVYYIFCIIIVFPTYKEMKAQYFENLGVQNFADGVDEGDYDRMADNRPDNRQNYGQNYGQNYEQNNNNNNRNNNRNNNNNNGGFVPFQGRGVAVGGN